MWRWKKRRRSGRSIPREIRQHQQAAQRLERRNAHSGSPIDLFYSHYDCNELHPKAHHCRISARITQTLSITQSDPADPGRRPSCCTSRRSRIEDGPQDARQIASRARTEHRGRRRLQADAALRVAPAGCALCSCRLCKATTRLITIRPCVHTGIDVRSREPRVEDERG